MSTASPRICEKHKSFYYLYSTVLSSILSLRSKSLITDLSSRLSLIFRAMFDLSVTNEDSDNVEVLY